MQQNGRLLVPVSIELDPPLLHQHSAEVFGLVEGIPRKIAFHGRSPLFLTHQNNPYVRAGGHIFI